MNIKKITDIIENFAPLELQESWDCSGFLVDLGEKENRNYRQPKETKRGGATVDSNC